MNAAAARLGYARAQRVASSQDACESPSPFLPGPSDQGQVLVQNLQFVFHVMISVRRDIRAMQLMSCLADAGSQLDSIRFEQRRDAEFARNFALKGHPKFGDHPDRFGHRQTVQAVGVKTGVPHRPETTVVRIAIATCPDLSDERQ